MDMKKMKWFGSRNEARLGRSYTTKPQTHHSSNDGSKKTVWQKIWRKVKRDKKKVFNYASSSGSSRVDIDGVCYDEETYSMNFDQGTGWMEADNLPRSFSARYADPSWILPPKLLLRR
ncbi:unnamed protein product [Lathyrus oleraceus]|uniref:Uncharacterized protein n=1 Tax=Pisum sativum TaxID=3888 RepID=A0A9D4WKZ7_PEA|nr:uncharacterized protein LOC127085090 [Pisum sativum]KAI5403413.1 hypothetical protein KIW84_050839 [Pisum sativum]